MSGETDDRVDLFLRVPAALKQALVDRANRRGISMNAQAIIELEEQRAADEQRAVAL
jgi:hypothetical protein